MDVKKLGKLIKTRRGSLGLTQGDLAKAVFGDAARKGDISRLENARVSNPHQATLQKTFTALALDHALLLELEGVMDVEIAEAPSKSGFLTLAQTITPHVSTEIEAYEVLQDALEGKISAPPDEANTHQALRVKIAHLNAKGAKKDALRAIEDAYADLQNRRAALRDIGLELLEMAEAQSLSLRKANKAAGIGFQRLVAISKGSQDFQDKVHRAWVRDFAEARTQGDGLMLRYLAGILTKSLEHLKSAPPLLLVFARARTQLEIANVTSRDEDYVDAAALFDEVMADSGFAKAEFRAEGYHDAGVAWRHVGALRADQEALGKAVTYLKSALHLRPKETMPEAWALTQNALGAALHSLGEMTQIDSYFETAVEAFELALNVRTKAHAPKEWATTQQNLGASLRMLADIRNDETMARQAVDAFQNALGERSEAATPYDWATTQNNLGGALALLGEIQRSATMMQEAVNAFRRALRIFTADSMPLDWARARINVSIALRSKHIFAPRSEEVLMAKQALSGVESTLIEHGATSMLSLYRNVSEQLNGLSQESKNQS